jgi:hypothetical protein
MSRSFHSQYTSRRTKIDFGFLERYFTSTLAPSVAPTERYSVDQASTAGSVMSYNAGSVYLMGMFMLPHVAHIERYIDNLASKKSAKLKAKLAGEYSRYTSGLTSPVRVHDLSDNVSFVTGSDNSILAIDKAEAYACGAHTLHYQCMGKEAPDTQQGMLKFNIVPIPNAVVKVANGPFHSLALTSMCRAVVRVDAFNEHCNWY